MSDNIKDTDDLVYLVQTDTTVGFVSKSSDKLAQIKKRKDGKYFLQNTSSFATLKSLVRIPNKYKKTVRNSTKTTFIYPDNQSIGKGIRVVKDSNFNIFLDRFDALYSTSANLSGSAYDEEFALKNADIIVSSQDGFSDNIPSRLFKLSKNQMRRVR